MRFTSKSWLIALLLLVSFLAGYWLRPSAPAGGTGAARKPLYWHDPMHPAYRSDKPGIAPDCGMQLEPVYAEDLATGQGAGRAAAAGTVRIGVEKQQIMGLRTAKVVRGPGSHTVRVLGRLAPDETRTYRVSALAEGVVRMVSPYAVGNVVEKDALLARYFVSAPEVFSAIQSYFVTQSLAAQGLDVAGNRALSDSTRSQIRMAEELLLTYGLTETQMREMARTRQPTRDIEFRAPVTGVVLARNVAVGQKLDRGTELFRIADLSHMWVLADFFENESGMIKPGAAARVRYQGRTYPASVADANQFDAVSRTLKVRLDLQNPGPLRPDMFVDIEFDAREPDGLTVPADAVLDSGRRRAAFVATGEGAFEPREVVTGARFGDRVQILKGLEEGENVVVSGLFLLDSESRLQLAAAGPGKASKAAMAAASDPVCGMEIDPARTAWKSEFEGAVYRFCSKTCKEKFDHSPSSFRAVGQPEAAKGGRS